MATQEKSAAQHSEAGRCFPVHRPWKRRFPVHRAHVAKTALCENADKFARAYTSTRLPGYSNGDIQLPSYQATTVSGKFS